MPGNMQELLIFVVVSVIGYLGWLIRGTLAGLNRITSVLENHMSDDIKALRDIYRLLATGHDEEPGTETPKARD